MNKILKNTTISDIIIGDTGITIPTSAQYTIPHQDYLLWAASSEIISFINSGDIIVNDGVKDLPVNLGLALLVDLEIRTKNVVRVSKDSPGYGDFSSIVSAIASITDSSLSNPYLITVGPGTYVLDNSAGPIEILEGIALEAQGHGTVIVSPQDPNQDLFLIQTPNSGVRIKGFSIKDVTGAKAIRVLDLPSPAIFDVLTISNCKTPISVESSTSICQAALRNMRLISGSTTERLLDIKAENGFASIVRIYSAILTDDNGTAFLEGVRVNGAGARLDPNTLLLRSTMGIGDGIALENGASLVGQAGFESDGFNKCLVTRNVGAAPSVFIPSCVLSNSVTADLSIEHPATTGDIFGIFRLSKFNNGATDTFTAGFQDPVTGDFNCTRILATRGFATELKTVSTSGVTTQILSTDPHIYVVSGSTSGEILRLPDATTLRVGHRYWIINESTKVVTIQQFGGASPVILSPFSSINYVVRDVSTQAGIWSKSFTVSSVFSGATTLLGFQNGNAGTGTYLEFFPGSSSLESPFIIPAATLLTALSLGSTATSTGTVGIFNVSDLVNPIASISLTNQSEKVVLNLSVLLNPMAEIAARCISGSMNKPKLAIYLSGA